MSCNISVIKLLSERMCIKVGSSIFTDTLRSNVCIFTNIFLIFYGLISDFRSAQSTCLLLTFCPVPQAPACLTPA